MAGHLPGAGGGGRHPQPSAHAWEASPHPPAETEARAQRGPGCLRCSRVARTPPREASAQSPPGPGVPCSLVRQVVRPLLDPLSSPLPPTRRPQAPPLHLHQFPAPPPPGSPRPPSGAPLTLPHPGRPSPSASRRVAQPSPKPQTHWGPAPAPSCSRPPAGSHPVVLGSGPPACLGPSATLSSGLCYSPAWHRGGLLGLGRPGRWLRTGRRAPRRLDT